MIEFIFVHYTVPCPHGTFGDECHNTCHCLSGSAYCRSLDGKCTDNKCSFGWINPPYCQTGESASPPRRNSLDYMYNLPKETIQTNTFHTR